MNKNILFFVPYGSYVVHHQVDLMISAALRERGQKVLLVLCDGIFENCILKENPPDEKKCEHCQKLSISLYKNLDLPMTFISHYLTQNDFKDCRQWADSLHIDTFGNARFENNDIGKWVYSNVCSYFHTGVPDLTNPRVIKVHRSFLYNGALISRLHPKLLTQFSPDRIVCYNARHSYYRVFYELSRRKDINVLQHERGFVDNSFEFRENAFGHLPCGRLNAWKKWLKIPLTLRECEEVHELLINREKGQYTNRSNIYRGSGYQENIRHALRIPNEKPIIAVFSGTEWELNRDRVDLKMSFASSCQVLREIAETMVNSDYYVVIRIHPNIVGDARTDKHFLKELIEMANDLPANARLIMPQEKIKSYSIIWDAVAAIVIGSTLGPEASARGLPTSSCVNNVYTAMELAYPVPDSPNYVSVINDLLVKGKSFGHERLVHIYRSLHFFIFKLSRIFQGIGIKDVYAPDIKIKNTEQVRPGIDPVLDDICDYFIEDKNIYPEPEEQHLCRDPEDENQFIKSELERIKIYKQQVKKNVSPLPPQPLLSVVRCRDNGKLNLKGTRFDQSLKRSRYGSIEMFEIATPAYYEAHSLIHELLMAVEHAKGDYIYFGCDNIQLDESFFSYTIDLLTDKNSDLATDVATVGAWTIDQNGQLGEIFTERGCSADLYTWPPQWLPDIRSAIDHNDFLQIPITLLSLTLWKRDSLSSFLQQFRNAALNQKELADNFFSSIFLSRSTITIL
ncbi:MAG: hypothetical protein HQK65_12805 [Desulfamplus sp.]|nr:hypothetical protein [Desulfamplus sp.]